MSSTLAALLALASCVGSGATSSWPPFSLEITPLATQVVRGQSAPVDAQILSANRLAGPVTLTLQEAPAGVSLSPSSSNGLPGKVILLTLATSPATPLGPACPR